MLLPFDCVKTFFEGHALVRITGASTEAIHECVVEMFDAPSVERRGATAAACVGSCARCQSQRVIDARESTIVCTRCGATEPYMDPANVAFEAAPTVLLSRKVRDDVPLWLRNASKFVGDEYHEYEVGEAVEHWNSYFPGGTHLIECEVQAAKKRALVPKRGATTVRCLAALLFPFVKQHFDLDELATRVQHGQRLPVLTPSENPNAKQWGELRCFKCQAIVSTPYEQKRHACNWGLSLIHI